MPIPAATRLVDFSPLSGSLPLSASRLFVSARRKEDEQAARLEEEFQRGRTEGLEVARAETEARIRAAEEAFEQRLAAARAQWADEEGIRFAARLETAMAELDQRVQGSVAAILEPLVEEKLRGRMVEELLRALERVLRGGRPASLSISGPRDILTIIQKTLGDCAAAIQFESTDTVDVRVVADQTVIETQLAEWLRRMRSTEG